MPVFNGELYIEEAIQSILRQDYLDYELLILNDGSTDRTKDIVYKYIDEKKIFLFDYERKGLIGILNEGLMKCKSEFIARMDADDICLPNRLSKQIEYFENNDKLGILGSGTYIVNSNGFLKYGHYPTISGGINNIMLDGNFICHPSAMFRAELIQKKGGYNQAFLHAEDYEFWLRCSEMCEINNTTEKLLMYREHDNNISAKKFAHQNMTAEIIKFLYQNKLSRMVSIPKSVDFEFLHSIAPKKNYDLIITKWTNDVRGMINSGRLNISDLDDYFLGFLNADK